MHYSFSVTDVAMDGERGGHENNELTCAQAMNQKNSDYDEASNESATAS